MRYFVFALMLIVAPAFAQDQTPAVGGEATQQLQQLSQSISETKRILIVGDQMAGGMGAGVTRMAENEDNIEVINRFNETSGLARPEIYDWAAAIPKMAEGKEFTTAFVLIGLNDRRDMRDGDKLLKFGSPEWAVVYKRRVDAVIDALSAQHMQVFWMGEPPMGEAELDADMQTLTTLQKERVLAKAATFIDLRAPFLGPDGKYSERGPDDTGADRRLRESDGVTFFKMGNNRLGQIALAALKSGGAAPSKDQNISAAPDAVSLTPVDPNQGPIFAQQDASGSVVANGSKDLAAAVAVDTEIKKADATSIIGIGAAKGSNADLLFTTGISKPAPAGRFDDFTTAGN